MNIESFCDIVKHSKHRDHIVILLEQLYTQCSKGALNWQFKFSADNEFVVVRSTGLGTKYLILDGEGNLSSCFVSGTQKGFYHSVDLVDNDYSDLIRSFLDDKS